MGDMADFVSNDFDMGPDDPGYEPGAETYTINKTSRSDPDFYHQEFRNLFKAIHLEHETTKAFLFNTEKGNFWCAKRLVRVKNAKDIFSWKIWKGFDYKFLPNDKWKGNDE